jgi:hypothetical protein
MDQVQQQQQQQHKILTSRFYWDLGAPGRQQRSRSAAGKSARQDRPVASSSARAADGADVDRGGGRRRCRGRRRRPGSGSADGRGKRGSGQGPCADGSSRSRRWTSTGRWAVPAPRQTGTIGLSSSGRGGPRHSPSSRRRQRPEVAACAAGRSGGRRRA